MRSQFLTLRTLWVGLSLFCLAQTVVWADSPSSGSMSRECFGCGSYPCNLPPALTAAQANCVCNIVKNFQSSSQASMDAQEIQNDQYKQLQEYCADYELLTKAMISESVLGAVDFSATTSCGIACAIPANVAAATSCDCLSMVDAGVGAAWAVASSVMSGKFEDMNMSQSIEASWMNIGMNVVGAVPTVPECKHRISSH